MNQPENEQITQDQWYIEDIYLQSYMAVGEEFPTSGLPDDRYKWFQMNINAPPESEQEKKEMKDAQMEQVRLGILKVQQPPQVQQQPFFQQQSNKIAGTFIPADIINGSLKQPVPTKKKKVGPNEPCPCGSGKKYKKCHARFD